MLPHGVRHTDEGREGAPLRTVEMHSQRIQLVHGDPDTRMGQPVPLLQRAGQLLQDMDATRAAIVLEGSVAVADESDTFFPVIALAAWTCCLRLAWIGASLVLLCCRVLLALFVRSIYDALCVIWFNLRFAFAGSGARGVSPEPFHVQQARLAWQAAHTRNKGTAGAGSPALAWLANPARITLERSVAPEEDQAGRQGRASYAVRHMWIPSARAALLWSVQGRGASFAVARLLTREWGAGTWACVFLCSVAGFTFDMAKFYWLQMFAATTWENMEWLSMGAWATLFLSIASSPWLWAALWQWSLVRRDVRFGGQAHGRPALLLTPSYAARMQHLIASIAPGCYGLTSLFVWLFYALQRMGHAQEIDVHQD